MAQFKYPKEKPGAFAPGFVVKKPIRLILCFVVCP
jgi:hypothetical protein